MRPSSLTRLNAEKNDGCIATGRCSHEFSWPRRGTDGDYYQVCLLCAVEYKYDWTTMRRTERVERKAETGIRRSHSREKRPSWVPRARRLKLDIPLRYRVNKTSTWHEGIIENISQSGVLFNGPQQLPVNALVEMVFEMPEEISGQKNSNVVCQGRVMRAKGAEQEEDPRSGRCWRHRSWTTSLFTDFPRWYFS